MMMSQNIYLAEYANKSADVLGTTNGQWGKFNTNQSALLVYNSCNALWDIHADTVMCTLLTRNMTEVKGG